MKYLRGTSGHHKINNHNFKENNTKRGQKSTLPSPEQDTTCSKQILAEHDMAAHEST
jgi:hypothetical protein